MTPIESRLDTSSHDFAVQRQGMLELVAQLEQLERRSRETSAKAKPVFDQRGALLPRERVARLLDVGTSFLEICNMAGYCTEDEDPKTSVPGGGQIVGIGFVSGVRCVVAASDSAINAGAYVDAGSKKLLRAQEIALRNRMPFVHLVESAGANLRTYRVERFIRGGALFNNLARLSAAGLPVITVVHGSSTAGGAYMPGLSDYVVMVRQRARAFLAGPPLLKAATGEIATEEELGGADMHARISGLAEYVGEDDAHAIAIAREIIAALDWPMPTPRSRGAPPLLNPQELTGVMPLDIKTPVDMQEVIGRVVDSSAWLAFKPDYGEYTLCGHARIEGFSVGIITNNGPIDPAGATKAAQFIQLCNQSRTPILFLQNTTGFIVGRASEEAGMIKHGSKMIQAISNSNVPHITLYCGASFGAGHYGMCGQSFGPHFSFSWPHAKTAVMGGEQAAMTLEMVARRQAQRSNKPLDEQALAQQKAEIIANFERQSSAFITSGLMLDDGIIDPRKTREVLAFVLATVREGENRQTQAIQFGVARF